MAADAAAYMSAFNPSLFTIRQFGGSWASGQETAADIHKGMLLGTALTLVTGFGGSAVSKSWVPLVAAVAVLIVLIAAYQWALMNPRGGQGS